MKKIVSFVIRDTIFVFWYVFASYFFFFLNPYRLRSEGTHKRSGIKQIPTERNREKKPEQRSIMTA